MICIAANLKINDPFKEFVAAIALFWDFALNIFSQSLHDMNFKVEFNIRVLELFAGSGITSVVAATATSTSTCSDSSPGCALELALIYFVEDVKT
jgi:predicted nicotinamide N-methyase